MGRIQRKPCCLIHLPDKNIPKQKKGGRSCYDLLVTRNTWGVAQAKTVERLIKSFSDRDGMAKEIGAMLRSREGGKGIRELGRVMANEATHLFYSRIQYNVKMGDRSVHRQNTSVVVPIQKIFVYPKFSTTLVVKNDIALLKLQHPVNFTANIYPICIPRETFLVKAGTKCWVTGWGKPDPGGKSWCSGHRPYS